MEKEQVQNLLSVQDWDTEIYSDNVLDHTKALSAFLEENNLSIRSANLTEKVGIPFIDEDSVAGVKAVLNIPPLDLEVHIVAYHHRQWDYYIEEVRNSPSDASEKNVDVVLLQTPLESGLNQESILSIANSLQPGEEYIPFSTSENNSSAHGFIRATVLEELDWQANKIEEFVKEMIGDMEKESENGFYEMDNGLCIYIGYE